MIVSFDRTSDLQSIDVSCECILIAERILEVHGAGVFVEHLGGVDPLDKVIEQVTHCPEQQNVDKCEDDTSLYFYIGVVFPVLRVLSLWYIA